MRMPWRRPRPPVLPLSLGVIRWGQAGLELAQARNEGAARMAQCHADMLHGVLFKYMCGLGLKEQFAKNPGFAFQQHQTQQESTVTCDICIRGQRSVASWSSVVGRPLTGWTLCDLWRVHTCV